MSFSSHTGAAKGAAVKGTGGPHEVSGGVGPGLPRDGPAAHPEAYRQVIRAKLFISQILEGEGLGADFHCAVAMLYRELWNRQVAIDDCQGGIVLEGCRGGPFHAHETVCKNGKTGIPFSYLRQLSGNRVVLRPKARGCEHKNCKGKDVCSFHVQEC